MAIDEQLVEWLLLADEWREQGRVATPEALCPARPELWPALRELLRGLSRVDRLRGANEGGASTGPEDLAAWPRIPDLALVRPLGRGGMGIVFEAIQESLGRRVAVKVLPPGSMSDTRNLLRFEREARAAARLHHTHIVPVFGVGRHEGVHYYVMQFIDGRGLDAVLDELRRRPGAGRHPGPHPGETQARISAGEIAQSLITGRFAGGEGTPPITAAAIAPTGRRTAAAAGLPRGADRGFARGVARIGVQVAEALAYAHEQGILHRDIKPSNLLLDADGQAWVADFGLAKPVDADDVTRSGDIVGTLRYLAPERFQGGGDARADIYALGLTLYELLAFRPAFEACDQAILMHQITQDDPPRLRDLNPSVPPDLETIVHKAGAREAQRRYATAAELADDLRKFLDDLPIRARRMGAWERFVRWCRSNPSTAALAGGIVLALIVGTAVASYFAIRATRGEELARRNEADAVANARRADRETQHAREEKRLSDRRLYVAEMHLAQQAWRDNRPDLVEQRLAEFVPERPGEADPRGFEWSYLRRLCQFGPRTLLGHPERVTSASYSPDGRTLAFAGADGLVILWDTATGRIAHVLTGHAKDEIDTLAFRPDGRTLASAGNDGTVRVWDTATGRRLMILRDHTDAVSGAAYSPDGRRIATGGHDAEVKLWDADTGRELRTLRGHTAKVYSLTYSPDGRTLASASSDRTVKLWDAETGREIRTLRGHSDAVRSLAQSPDGRTLASASWDRTIKLWDVDSGREIRTLRGHTGPLTGVAYGPDGRHIASVAWDGALRLWDAASGQELRTFRGHSRIEINGVAYSPDGRHIASVGWDRTVKLWDVATADPEAMTLRGHAGTVSDLAFSPDGHILASAGWDRAVKLWDAVTGLELRALRGHAGRIQAVAFSPDGRGLVTGGLDRTVKLWDVADGRPVRTLCGHSAGIHRVAWSPDGALIASAGLDGTVRLWETAEGREVRTLRGHEGEVRGVAFSPDGRTLASGGGDQTIKLWDAASGREIQTLYGHAAEVDAVAFSPDGRRLVSASEDRTAKFWDLDTGQEVIDLRGHADQVRNVAFSPDGLTLATASGDETVKLWPATPATPELRVLREARGVVEFFFAGSSPIADVLDRIRSDAALAPEVRQRALDLAEPYGRNLAVHQAERLVESLYARPMFRPEVLEGVRRAASLGEPVRQEALALAERVPENPRILHKASWSVGRRPDADAAAYRLALRRAEAACRLIPDDEGLLEALGVAQYRAGMYGDAAGTLSRADRLSTALAGDPTPAELAFLALSQNRLGRTDQARATLGRLRELMKRPERAGSEQDQDFLREAQALEDDPSDPLAP